MSLITQVLKNYCDVKSGSLDRQEAVTAILAVREANRNEDGTYDNKFTLAERKKFEEICESAKVEKFVFALFVEKGQGCSGDLTVNEIQIADSADELKRFMDRTKFGDEFVAESSRTKLGECKATEPAIDPDADLLDDTSKKQEEIDRWDGFDGTGLGGGA